MKPSSKLHLLAAAFLAVGCLSARAQSVLITEVHSAGSGNGTYAADWFELTNVGSNVVSVTGWTMDDNTNLVANSVALRGVASLNPGQSAVFIEAANGTTDANNQAAFKTAWFGSSVPAGLLLGGYSGSSVGLSTTTDAVNIFNPIGMLVTRVDFNAATANRTFDNSALGNNVTISTLSTVGVNGAFLSADGKEIGSPGLAAIPEPSAYAGMLGLAVLGATSCFRRRRGAAVAA